MPFPDESSAVPVLIRVKLPEASSPEYPTTRPGEPMMFGRRTSAVKFQAEASGLLLSQLAVSLEEVIAKSALTVAAMGAFRSFLMHQGQIRFTAYQLLFNRLR